MSLIWYMAYKRGYGSNTILHFFFFFVNSSGKQNLLLPLVIFYLFLTRYQKAFSVLVLKIVLNSHTVGECVFVCHTRAG